MKKAIFAVLAAFVMCLGFVSCSSTPEEKLIGVAEDMVGVLKSTHIKSASDVEAMMAKLASYKEKGQKLTEELIASYKDKTPDELSKLQETMKPLEEKVMKLQEDNKKELERLAKEAKEAGVDLDLSELRELF